jgi:hypothetical protein
MHEHFCILDRTTHELYCGQFASMAMMAECLRYFPVFILLRAIGVETQGNFSQENK